MHADFQGAAHVVAGLADAGEHHAVGTAASGQHALQLTAGDDVEACAQARQHVQHAEVGVGLDREAHQVLGALQGVGVAAVLGLDVGARVHVGRGAEAFGDGRQGHAFREQFTVAVVESVHGLPLLVLVRLRLLTVFAFVWQVQRALLAAGGNEAGNRDERREGGDQALHGVILCNKQYCARVYRAPAALPMRAARRRAGAAGGRWRALSFAFGAPRSYLARLACVQTFLRFLQ
ncbi:hypothetical protein D3C76_970650 [compost metagenome]